MGGRVVWLWHARDALRIAAFPFADAFLMSHFFTAFSFLAVVNGGDLDAGLSVCARRPLMRTVPRACAWYEPAYDDCTVSFNNHRHLVRLFSVFAARHGDEPCAFCHQSKVNEKRGKEEG